MKTNKWSRNQMIQMARTTALLVGVVMACKPSALAQQSSSAAKPSTGASADADVDELNNWVELEMGRSGVSGDAAQYQRQSGLPANDTYSGIKSLHVEQSFAKKGLVTIDGRGIFDNHDYDLDIKASHPDYGYVKAGFRQYREYYDNAGGYWPSNNLSFVPANQVLTMDRGTAFFEGALMLPDMPVLKLRYEHDYRSGGEDSTEWNSTRLTGPNQTVNSAVTKKIAPDFLGIDEKTDSIAVDVSHNIRSTDLALGVRYDWIRNYDSQNELVYPTQTTSSTYNHTLTSVDKTKNDIFNVHGSTDTKLGEKWEVTSGYSYTDLHMVDIGSRYDSAGTPTGGTGSLDSSRYPNLSAAAAVEQYEMNLGLMYSPGDNWYIVPSARIEKVTTESTGSYNTFASGSLTSLSAFTIDSDNESQVNAAQSLDARYVGITNFVFYVRNEWEENRDAMGQSLGAQTNTVANDLLFLGSWHQLSQKYTGGINWYPERGLNLALQYYHKIDENSYENNTPPDSTAGSAAGATPLLNYPGFMKQENFITDDANFRVTWRPCSKLTTVTRYDFQYTTVDFQGAQYAVGVQLAQIPSAQTITHMIGETVSWTPINRLYTELGLNYVLNTTHTGAEGLTGALGGVVLASQNNYWTFNTMAGYAFDDKTDVRATYTYYRSDDYTDNSALTVPYGAGGEEHTFGVTLGRKFTKTMSGTLGYTFQQYRDQLFGGLLNYQSSTILATVKYRF
jgi:hypothetical protein